MVQEGPATLLQGSVSIFYTACALSPPQRILGDGQPDQARTVRLPRTHEAREDKVAWSFAPLSHRVNASRTINASRTKALPLRTGSLPTRGGAGEDTANGREQLGGRSSCPEPALSSSFRSAELAPIS